jgi:NADH-quinone oxidoreductase subunit E
MALRRLAEHQPETFTFTPENMAWVEQQIGKYPPGRQASAVIPVLWRAQEQEGWVTRPMVEEVGRILGMPYMRVLEVATFYTMFNLHPVGRRLVQVCTTTPCWLRGSDEVVAACKQHIHPQQNVVSADGEFSWYETECLGACVNAPMILVDKDPYEDLDAQKMAAILAAYRRGEQEGGATTLIDRSIYADGATTRSSEQNAPLTDAAAKRAGDPASVRDAPAASSGGSSPKGTGA